MNLEFVVQSEVRQKEETNTVCYCVCMEYRKTVQMSLFAEHT